jgi:hypothetical protein
MVPRARSKETFGGTKSEWIQAAHLGYVQPPVRLAEDTRTQGRMDRMKAVRTARNIQLVRELSKLNPWESFSYWLEQQQYHPIRWKVIGFTALGIFCLIFWQLILAVLLGVGALIVLLSMVG